MVVTAGRTPSVWRRVLGSRVVGALAAPHGVDRYLELVNPLWSVSDIRAEITDVAHPTRDSVTIGLRPNANWPGAAAGQHVRLGVDVDGVRRTRCFSLASPEHETGRLEITARANPRGTVSRYLKARARPGMIVGLSAPEGDFVLPEDPGEHVVLISGGSGITPVMSILRTLVRRGHPGRITFLHYARTPADVVYRDELASHARAHPALRVAFGHPSHPGAGALTGRFGPDHLSAGDTQARCYTCGPPPLVDAVGELWTGAGQLHVERYTGPALAVRPAVVTGRVRFVHSGFSVANDGRPLLVQAEAAGLTPEHGCRRGICHSCTTVKHAGAVVDLRDGAVTTEPEAHVQLCVTAPCGDVELDL